MPESGAWRGHLCFLTAAFLWAVYTVVFRQSGLTPMHALAIGLFWSAVVGLPILLWLGVPFRGAGPQAIVVMGLLQGLLMGFLSLLLYRPMPSRALGAAETGAFGGAGADPGAGRRRRLPRRGGRPAEGRGRRSWWRPASSWRRAS